MKKILILLFLCACTGGVSAQNVTIAPFDNTLNGKLTQPFKLDSTWRTLPPSVSTDKFFKQEDIDINKITMQKQLLAQINPGVDYNMPVIKLQGYSKMPVIRLEGNSNMPVLGKDPNKGKRITKVNP